MFYLDYLYVCIYGDNCSLLILPWYKIYHDDPLFLSYFWVTYMHIFHFAKGQENSNSRSKMAHLPLKVVKRGNFGNANECIMIGQITRGKMIKIHQNNS